MRTRPNRIHIVHVGDPLYMPASRSVRHHVLALLRHGERRIILDLSAVSRMDAAGVGELIRAFNMTAAMNGTLRIVNATTRVREMLERARLFDFLSGASRSQATSRLSSGVAAVPQSDHYARAKKHIQCDVLQTS